ncbi:unnamed protein product, partial [Prorocentrum cordatum]
MLCPAYSDFGRTCCLFLEGSTCRILQVRPLQPPARGHTWATGGGPTTNWRPEAGTPCTGCRGRAADLQAGLLRRRRCAACQAARGHWRGDPAWRHWQARNILSNYSDSLPSYFFEFPPHLEVHMLLGPDSCGVILAMQKLGVGQ